MLSSYGIDRSVMSMAPSAEPLLTIWADLNRRYFHDALPPIPSSNGAGD